LNGTAPVAVPDPRVERSAPIRWHAKKFARSILDDDGKSNPGRHGASKT